MKSLLLLTGLIFATGLSAQTVQVPYSGQAPYNGSMSVQVSVTGLPSGCSVGTPTYAAGTIAVPVNCGVVPPPVGTNCASATTPVTGCAIGNTVAVVNNPGNVRGTPTAGGGNGPLMGTQPGGAKGVIVTNPIPQSTAGKGWQVVNFGAPNSCNAAGPYSQGCGYVGNDNLAPSTTPPPTAPVVTCAPSSVQTGGTSNCSGNQAITSWKASAGTITSAGVFTAPATAQTVTITGTNANGSGTTPVAVTSTSACAQTYSASGGVDNAALLSKLQAAGPTGCVEMLLAGKLPYNFTPFSNVTGNIIVDDGVTIVDSGIFGRTTPLFSLGSDGFSIQGKGPLFSAQISMPTNYANALKEVAEGNDYEYQHCFGLVNGVSRITISGIKLFHCAGDGVDMDDTTEAISINVDSSGNIRQGVSCTGAVNGATLTGNLHDGPLTGFDCEPDANITGNITLTVTNLKTSGNKGGGRSYGFMNLLPPTKLTVVDTGGTSTNDTGSGFAFWNRNSGTNQNATGTLTISGFTITGSSNYCMGGNKSTDGYKVIASNGTISGCGTSALHLAVAGGETGTPGGVAWSGITITGTAPATSFASNTAQTTITNSTYNSKPLSYP
jgi:hypothetical protein